MLHTHVFPSTSWRLLVGDYSKSVQSSWQSRPQRKQCQDGVINSVHSSSLQFPISGNKIQSRWLARLRVACGAFSTHNTTTGHWPRTCWVSLQLLALDTSSSDFYLMISEDFSMKKKTVSIDISNHKRIALLDKLFLKSNKNLNL